MDTRWALSAVRLEEEPYVREQLEVVVLAVLEQDSVSHVAVVMDVMALGQVPQHEQGLQLRKELEQQELLLHGFCRES